MDMPSYDAILFPADGRPPHLVDLMTSPRTQIDPTTGQFVVTSIVPHPEMHMEFRQDVDQGAWGFQIIDSLEGMSKPFPEPYIIFYPIASRLGTQLSVNHAIQEIQGKFFNDENAWYGNIVIAKYQDRGQDPFLSLTNISMADFPILKNYLTTRRPFTGRALSGSSV